MTKEQELFNQENKVLEALAADASLQQRLRPIRKEEVVPGLLLIYELGDGHGCHILRSKGEASYKDAAGLKKALQEGQFLTLEDDVEL